MLAKSTSTGSPSNRQAGSQVWTLEPLIGFWVWFLSGTRFFLGAVNLEYGRKHKIKWLSHCTGK